MEVTEIINSKWALETEEKEHLMNALTQELTPLRTKAEISQGELARLIGVSRQTYGAIERMVRPMTWSIYLSLLLFFDYNLKTKQMLRSLGIFPQEIIARFNDGVDIEMAGIGRTLGNEVQGMLGKLDEQAICSLKTLIAVEYVRCSGITDETVARAFSGSSTPSQLTDNDKEIFHAIHRIRQKSNDENNAD